MEHRQLGKSGLRIPVLSFGTATFGGQTDFFKAWGNTDVAGARRMVDLCLDAGLNFFDTADGYSDGKAEEILGQALEGRRNQVLISTKATFPTGSGPNDFGSSRYHLIEACEKSLRRLKTDHIDVYYMHGFDATSPLEETLSTLDTLVKQGKVRYIACSNYSGWHLMKSLSISERYGWSKYVAHQAYYSLLNREFEWELMPLGIDQGVGTLIWSPLAGGLLTGKVRKGHAPPPTSRLGQADFISYSPELLYPIVDAMDRIAKETGKSIIQIALNWLLQRPTVSSVIIGARDETQLKHNLGAVGWNLTPDQVTSLDQVSERLPTYPYWHQRMFEKLNPPPIKGAQ